MKNHPGIQTGALHSRKEVLLVTTPGQWRTHSKPERAPLQHHQQAVKSRGAFEPDKQNLRLNRIWMVANNESSASSPGQKSAR
jgi:hypothetical protein